LECGFTNNPKDKEPVMSHEGGYAEKHAPDARVNPRVAEAIAENAKDAQLPCAVAFRIAEQLGVAPAEVGRGADLLSVRLAKCQLGLFGYTERKKIVGPSPSVPDQWEKAIRASLAADRLPCVKAWELASRFGVGKMEISAACERLGVKIKPCQLGAF